MEGNGDKRPVYADSTCRSKEREADLAKQNITSQICEKGNRGRPLNEEQKAANHEKSRSPSSFGQDSENHSDCRIGQTSVSPPA